MLDSNRLKRLPNSLAGLRRLKEFTHENNPLEQKPEWLAMLRAIIEDTLKLGNYSPMQTNPASRRPSPRAYSSNPRSSSDHSPPIIPITPITHLSPLSPAYHPHHLTYYSYMGECSSVCRPICEEHRKVEGL
jgi:hypothetical protein